VGIYDKKKSQIYIYGDGQLEANYSVSGSPSSDTGPIHIMHREFNSIGTNHINGTIDEVRIWNRSLSAEEVKQHYMSNLRKFNETRWKLEVNQTKNSTSNLKTGSYIYKASAQGSAGYDNSTEKRTINIDLKPPFLDFANPTPADGKTKTQNKNATINITSNDIESSLKNDSLVHSTFLDWNHSLVGWWEMDFSNSTGIHDNSTYNNFGTFNGGLSQSNKTDGARGKGLEFDGNDDRLDIDESVIPSGREGEEITASFWIRPDDMSSTETILGINDEWLIRLENNGHIWTRTFGGNNGGTSESLNQNKWYHLTAIWVPNQKHEIYLNGTKIQSVSSSDTSSSTGTIFTIGERGTSSGENFKGSIDSVQIYDRALSSTEIKALYNATKDQYQ
ncbi:MAG: LamG-like jellyroll fold domain-containing protein, partial [Candidatus Pacearchaeota archaeon]